MKALLEEEQLGVHYNTPDCCFAAVAVSAVHLTSQDVGGLEYSKPY